MAHVLTLGGRLLLADGRLLTDGITPPAAGPSAIPDLAAWWDSGTPSAVLNGSATPAGYGGTVASLTDLSGNGATLAAATPGQLIAPVKVMPRLVGTMPGVGAAGPQLIGAGAPITTLYPTMDATAIFGTATSFQVGSGADWTLMLVWSRPNWRQHNTSGSDGITVTGTTASPLVQVGGFAILTLDNGGASQADASSTLALFGTALSTTVTRRHTHVILLRHTHGAGVDVWLDGTQIATGVANTLAASFSGTLTLLSDGTAKGSAQCWFHEGAFWTRALTGSEITGLINYSARWPLLGRRRGYYIVPAGQSNMAFMMWNDGGSPLFCAALAYQMGALAVNIASSLATLQGSHGIATKATGGTLAFLNNLGDGNPAGWPVSTDGSQVQPYLAGLPAIDSAEFCATMFYHSENDGSNWLYGDKATYAQVRARWLALIRGYIAALNPGSTVANTPHLDIPVLFLSTAGQAMVREVMQDAADDPAQNVWLYTQTSEALDRSADSYTGPGDTADTAYDPATGFDTVGSAPNYGHRSAADNKRFAQLFALRMAPALMASGQHEAIGVLPAGVSQGVGPRITGAVLISSSPSSSVVRVTVQHDAGTDLVLPLQAVNGAGWVVLTGMIPSASNNWAAAGNISLAATAAARVDATHIDVTFPGTVAAGNALYYPFPGGEAEQRTSSYHLGWIGRGNAVTDNYGTLSKPDGWDIGHDIGGSGAGINMPLASPMHGVVIS